MFRKLDLNFSADDFTKKDDELVRYGVVEDGEFRGIVYNHCALGQKLLSEILARIPPSKANYFLPTFMEINREIPPHTDSNVKTVINLYVKTGGYVTDFNVIKDGAKKIKIENQTNGYLVDFDQVDVVDSFIAEDGEAYILDVTKLHSVHSGKGGRAAIALSTNLSFDEVCELVA